MNSDHHWQEGDAPDPDNHFGYIYEMHHMPTGHRYIGRKQFWSSTGKRKHPLTDIRGTKWVAHHWKPSDWRTYVSSSKVVNEMMTNKDEWEFAIIQQLTCKRDMSYAEPAQMYRRGVGVKRLENGELLYLNKHIPDFHGAVSGNFLVVPEVGRGATRTKLADFGEAVLKEHGPGTYRIGYECPTCGSDRWRLRWRTQDNGSSAECSACNKAKATAHAAKLKATEGVHCKRKSPCTVCGGMAGHSSQGGKCINYYDKQHQLARKKR